jgi:translation initiation factor IF-2
MADANKPVRLNLIAREFNLGIQTIVDFLAGKGIEVDAKPNTKIDATAVALVRANFQDEKVAKAKAVSSANRAVIERTSVTLASARKKPDAPEEPEVELDLSVFQKSQQPPVVQRVKNDPVEEVATVPEPVKEEGIVAPEPVKAEAEEKAVEKSANVVEVEEEKKEPLADGPVKVLGKVDLDAVSKKSKPKSKKEKLAEKAKLEKKSAEITKK